MKSQRELLCDVMYCNEKKEEHVVIEEVKVIEDDREVEMEEKGEKGERGEKGEIGEKGEEERYGTSCSSKSTSSTSALHTYAIYSDDILDLISSLCSTFDSTS